MPPNRFESEVESFLEGSHGDRTHIKRADHHTVTPLCGTLLNCETAITTATEKRIKNAHFSPAKAMAVSTPHGHERAKATPVSRERFVMPAGYGGAWPGFETTRRATRQRPSTADVEGAGGTGGQAAVPEGEMKLARQEWILGGTETRFALLAKKGRLWDGACWASFVPRGY